MKGRSLVREIAAIVMVAAALVGAQVGAHVVFSFYEATHVWLDGTLEPGMTEAAARSVLVQRYDLVKADGEKYDLRAKDGSRSWTGGGTSSQRTEGAGWFH